MPTRITSSFAAVGLLAVLVYANTLIGDFTFDDNFAVITNGDVTNDAIPIRDLFKHDFWGQDIASQQSHKSYRPLTILAFRWTRKAWSLITAAAPGLEQQLPSPPAAVQQQLQQQDVYHAKPARPAGLHPFPFHVLCVMMHAIVSMMVLALSQHLFAVLEQCSRTAQTLQAMPGNANSSSLQHRSGRARGNSNSNTRSEPSSNAVQDLMLWRMQPPLWQVPVSFKYQAQAWIAALMFALHPIHTEAVAGIVGCAELICAAWSIPALLLYFMAVDGQYAGAQQLQQHLNNNSTAASTSSTTKGPVISQHQNDVPASRAKGGARQQDSAAGTQQHLQQRSQQQSQQAAKAVVAPVGSSGSSTAPAGSVWLADSSQHWLLVVSSAGLALCAALSKEIGITIVGTMVLYDLLMAPHMRPEQHNRISSSRGSGSSSSGSHVSRSTARRRQLLRILLMAATAVMYVRLRQWVAVQQLVAIYRKVENPIPFAKPFFTRASSTAYLHARYFGLLLLPIHLSADWSFNCIPLVEHWSDGRNKAALALYAYFLHTALAAQPVGILQQLWSSFLRAIGVTGISASPDKPDTQQQEQQQHAASSTPQAGAAPKEAAEAAGSSAAAQLAHRRWRLLVLVGLLIAPFFPASNVLFYVGTFIGERLLYFPSVGFCLLAADLLGAFLPATWLSAPQQHLAVLKQQQQQTETCSAPPEQQPRQMKESQEAHQGNKKLTDEDAAATTTPAPTCGTSPSTSPVQGCVLLVCALVLLLGGYAARTLLRNQDWWDEERLFLAALKVCPNSAKVQQNSGVLQRRYQNYTQALKHFRRAQEIEPGYCEPSYWIGLTQLNQGDVLSGVSGIRASLPCKYTAVEALQTLNKVYLMMHENGRGNDPAPLLEWAGVLALPSVLRIADACATAEDAALIAALTGRSRHYVDQAVDVCLQGIREWQHSTPQPDTLPGIAKQRFGSSLNTSLMQECVVLRRDVYRKMVGNTVTSRPVRRAIFRYIAQVSKKHPACRTLAGGGNAAVDESESAPGPQMPPTHQKLLHRVQSADPEDPWLQMEWGATLIALQPQATQNLKEAARHLDVSSAIFMRISQEHLSQADWGNKEDGSSRGAGQELGSGRKGSRHKQQGSSRSEDATVQKLLQVTALDGKVVLTPQTALEAAMQPLEAFKMAAGGSSDFALGETYCEVLKRLCHLRLQMVMLLQQQGGGSSRSLPGSGSIKKLLKAKAAGRRCLVEISERKGCERQAAELGRVAQG